MRTAQSAAGVPLSKAAERVYHFDMWTRTRPLIALSLALILAVTSVTMSVARGQTRVAGEIVICTGLGITTLAVDATGRPVGVAHICPDMVLGLMAALDLAPPVLLRPEGVDVAVFAADLPRMHTRTAPPSRARDPPALV